MLISACECCNSLTRRDLIAGLGAATGAAILPSQVFAAYEYEAMILSCIDPRFQAPVARYAKQQGLKGKYSKFTVAGASIGVVAPAFKKWHKTFWDNLGASVQLHKIKRVIAINHRDCGAARIAYGKEKNATPELETETHRAAMAEFRKQMAQNHPQLAVETYLMAKGGKAETI